MTESPLTQAPSGLQRLRACLLQFCKHPASLLVWFCLISLIVQEQYPFSHYPMYSGWSDRTHYFYIADEEGPIKAKLVFKVSVPRTKKLYGGIIKKIEQERGVDHDELTEADFAEAGRRLLKKLRDEAPPQRREKYAKIIDGELSLVRVEIIRDDKEFITEKKTVVTTGADNQIIEPTAPRPNNNT